MAAAAAAALVARHAGKRLRETMQQRCVVLPGAFNGLVGRLVAEASFEGCYISGGAISAAKGQPDVGLLSLNDFCGAIKEVTQVSGLPCIADADTGFGEVEMVSKTVVSYNASGAAGMHIEDQVFPKRCGHLDSKTLISVDEMVEKVKRAKSAAIQCSGGSFIVCARTDARGVDGLDEAIKRSKEYVSTGGADMIFPEGLASEEEFEAFAKEMKRLPVEAPGGGPYLLANMTEFGKTPMIPVHRFAALGYHCVIFPVSTLRVAMKPIQQFLKTLKDTGTAADMLDRMYTRQELYKTLKYTPGVEWTFPNATKAHGDC